MESKLTGIMNTKIILGIILLIILLFARFMNPNKRMHVQKISYLIESPLSNSNKSSVENLMEEMMFESFIELDVDYADYWFYSIGYYQKGLTIEIQSFGIFGRAFIISN